ncbi:hypothetical protein [Liquorilactobacillus satsumensis]|uniref:Uncharacterized protein n=1 Tax=Liquorilactobacillus satsumensis DSM 16230 = JCM 12392 TaxID=1423801 RepID=A0A0R1UXC4_9LACO|nr:hypothetical protein [Liquorilactobacillus satsumensis]KRL97904.1 hypothetical protein FD50_GL001113 [Liquorilactobacillus satsumensis DSM 16230 = JCM 12392]
MGKMEVDRHGFKIEEHVFHRYFSLYTIGLRYYPELFNLLEQHPDPENPRTISSNMNVVFAILRYQEMTKDLVSLQAVSQVSKTEGNISCEVKELQKIIDTLEHLQYMIAHDPSVAKNAQVVKDKILDLDHFRK